MLPLSHAFHDVICFNEPNQGESGWLLREKGAAAVIDLSSSFRDTYKLIDESKFDFDKERAKYGVDYFDYVFIPGLLSESYGPAYGAPQKEVLAKLARIVQIKVKKAKAAQAQAHAKAKEKRKRGNREGGGGYAL